MNIRLIFTLGILLISSISAFAVTLINKVTYPMNVDGQQKSIDWVYASKTECYGKDYSEKARAGKCLKPTARGIMQWKDGQISLDSLPNTTKSPLTTYKLSTWSGSASTGHQTPLTIDPTTYKQDDVFVLKLKENNNEDSGLVLEKANK